MTTIDGNVRLTRHVGDLDDDGHDTVAGFTPVVVSAECNAPGSGTQLIDFDTFYDVDGVDLMGVLPAGLGLSYAAGVFTPTEDGVWVINVAWFINATPGVTGELRVEIDGPYGAWPRHFVAASGNSDATNTSMWFIERTFRLKTGASDQFFGEQIFASGTPLSYVVMDIIRIANKVV